MFLLRYPGLIKRMKSQVELHLRLNVSTVQLSVFARGDLKSQYAHGMTSFAKKLQLFLW